MKYIATVTTVFEIEAENIAQAHMVAKKFRTIPEVIGSKRSKNDRDLINYSTERLSHSVKIDKVD